MSMICPRCGTRLHVRNTEKLLPHDEGTPRPIVRKAMKVVGWYTSDFVARVRVCTSCKYNALTIELEAKDFNQMFQEVHVTGLTVTSR